MTSSSKALLTIIIVSVSSLSCRSYTAKTESSQSTSLSSATVSSQPSYDLQIASAKLTSSQILKSASAAYISRQLTDKQVGSIRAQGRRVSLEITIAESTLELYQSRAATKVQLDKSISEMNKSLSIMVKLWRTAQ